MKVKWIKENWKEKEEDLGRWTAGGELFGMGARFIYLWEWERLG